MIDTYYLTSDIEVMCKFFADRVISTNIDQYKKRNQFNQDKIWKDIYYGKLAEWGVYFIYLKRGRKNIDPPDMKVYNAWQKSFDPDLKWGLFNLHIKSQTYDSSLKYGNSWIFQAKDPLFGYCDEYDIVIGCIVKVEEKSVGVTILLEKPFKNIIFGETKLSKFSGDKKAMYLKDNNG